MTSRLVPEARGYGPESPWRVQAHWEVSVGVSGSVTYLLEMLLLLCDSQGNCLLIFFTSNKFEWPIYRFHKNEVAHFHGAILGFH